MAATGDARPATVPGFDFDVFDHKCAELGATTDTARAELLGINRTTLWRWRNGLYSPEFAVVTRIAQRLGVSLDELTKATP